MNKNKIIVTGACGFIASHLIDALVDLDYEVFGIDDLSAESNERFYYNDKALYSHNDINDLLLINYNIFKECKCIFHLAAESRIGPAIKNPIKAVKTNVLGTTVLLEIARQFGIEKFIYSSTSSVYGLDCELPTAESSSINCLNPYSASKFGGEEMVRMYSKMYGLDTCIFRYFNVFGERSPTKGQYAPVIGIFLKNLKDNKPLQIVGDGEQCRDFVHVQDVVHANLLALHHCKPIMGDVFNVGTGQSYSIYDISTYISNRIEHIPARAGDAQDTLANITKIKKVLGYKPTINVKDWILSKVE